MKLTKKQFAKIEHIMPDARKPTTISNYQFLCALLYIMENGCKWRALPKKYGNCHDVPEGRKRIETITSSHIIYVNGSYDDVSSPIGKLIHDFWCEEPEDMYYRTLSESVKHFKKEEGGQEIMSSLLEQFVQEERQEGKAEGKAEGRAEGKAEEKRESARRMIQKGKLSLLDIAEYLDMPLEEIEDIAEEM